MWPSIRTGQGGNHATFYVRGTCPVANPNLGSCPSPARLLCHDPQRSPCRKRRRTPVPNPYPRCRRPPSHAQDVLWISQERPDGGPGQGVRGVTGSRIPRPCRLRYPFLSWCSSFDYLGGCGKRGRRRRYDALCDLLDDGLGPRQAFDHRGHCARCRRL